MASPSEHVSFGNFVALSIIVVVVFAPGLSLGAVAKYNVIDKCWKQKGWRRDRYKLATCSVGFSGKMSGNIGKGVVRYNVTNPGDDPLKPKPGTLRYGTSMIKGKVWITFMKDMTIKLKKSLIIGSFTTIDGRGATVHIAGGGCLTIFKAHDIIIHGLHIHDCKPQEPSLVMGPGRNVLSVGNGDADGIRVNMASNIWIDHNTLYRCPDGLVDVCQGSRDITISNNRFSDQDKVMLLGNDDNYYQDKNMYVTIVYNRFGPNCEQRMPRLRFGYAHVANNLYEGWGSYAIGGTSDPTIKSEANVFISKEQKEVTLRNGSGKFYSSGDLFRNGATFTKTSSPESEPKLPKYKPEQMFRVAGAKSVPYLTRSAGAY